MNSIKHFFFLFCLVAVASLSIAAESVKPAAPFVNPYLAASSYPVTHATSDFSPVAGPVGPSRRLHANEVQWKPIGPVNGWTVIYSGLYPNGKRVIWVGGYDRVAKLDADTLEILTTYAIGGNTYFGEEEIGRHIATMDKLGDKDLPGYNLKLWEEPFPDVVSFYRLLSKENELYLPHRAKDGTISLQVYGEVDAADPASKIVLRREWKIPGASKATLFGVNMTADGWIVLVTADGSLFAVSRDFTKHYSVKLPRQKEEGAGQDVFSAFVRNGISTDDQGGIYVVTRDNMHRVQWTGSKLSLDEADGAWSAPYPNELGHGSGTTPGLMGWGQKEDHLVVIADGTGSNNMVAFWRDGIPDDWKGLPGHDRRIAGITPIQFGISKNEKVRIENAPIIYGQGAFFNNIDSERRLPDQGSPSKQWIAEAFLKHVPGYEAFGGTMIRWDPQARELKTAWQSKENFVIAVCMASSPNDTLYCWGNRNREWTLEGVDWYTGKSVFHYTLGKSHRFNPLGGPIIVAPNGAVDCGCSGGLGMVRVRPGKKS